MIDFAELDGAEQATGAASGQTLAGASLWEQGIALHAERARCEAELAAVEDRIDKAEQQRHENPAYHLHDASDWSNVTINASDWL